ncbi:MAG: hypothetical protein ACKORG_01025 [Actinomycetota bacterium]
MPDVRIDQSVSPAAHRAGMLAALEAGHVDNRFHYVGERSAAMWRALASAHSPAQADDGLTAYDAAARAALALLPGGPVHVIGVACGDGVKERRLLGALVSAGRRDVCATAVDVSVPLVTAAAEAMGAVPGTGEADAVAVDITAVHDLSPLLAPRRPGTRLVTLFGVVSTLGPGSMAPALSLLAPGDVLMVSANLLPDRPGARDHVMAQYDNPPTRAWLMAVLEDIGLGGAGDIAMRWEEDAGSLAIVGEVTPAGPMVADVEGITVAIPPGRPVRVLESFRHDPAGLGALMTGAGMRDAVACIAPSGEEGVAVGVA